MSKLQSIDYTISDKSIAKLIFHLTHKISFQNFKYFFFVQSIINFTSKSSTSFPDDYHLEMEDHQLAFHTENEKENYFILSQKIEIYHMI